MHLNIKNRNINQPYYSISETTFQSKAMKAKTVISGRPAWLFLLPPAADFNP
jgi:hypothetical protein